MRKVLFIALLVIIAVPLAVIAQPVSRPSFQIPFAFVAGDTDFPAGNCTLEPKSTGSSLMTLWCGGNNSKVGFLVGGSRRPLLHSEIDKGGGYSFLVFQRLGSHYFLREYQDASTESRMLINLSKKKQQVLTILLSSTERSEKVIVASKR